MPQVQTTSGATFNSEDLLAKESSIVTLTGTQTLTNKTLTAPTINSGTLATPTITSPTITGVGQSETKFCTTQVDATSNTTLANITGMTGFTATAAGVYKFDIHLAGTSTANGGMKVALKYTTATLTNMEATGRGYTASGVAVQHTTTATDQASLFALTAAATINVVISGRITVNAAGTIAVQFAQNASHADTSSVYVGSWATFERIS